MNDQTSNDQKRKRFSFFLDLCKKHNLNSTYIIIILIMFLIIAGLVLFITISNRPVTEYTTKTLEFGLRDIGELATQAGYYTNVNIIENANRTIAGVPIPLTSSKAIMTYTGTIKAGIDFDQIIIDINDETKIVSLTMPNPRILSNEIDLNSFEKYDESNSIFNPINVENYNQSLIEMKSKAETQAISNGIFEAAKSNAESLIGTMFKNVSGSEEYKLVFKWNISN